MDLTKTPTPLSHRFTLELEFVLCLANPHYLQYLAVNYPHLLNKPTASHSSIDIEDSDAARFTRYLKYLYEYWRTPQYAKYLTHPGATLRNLELLQQEQFRRDIIRPDVVAKLLETDASQIVAQDVSAHQDPATESEQPGA
ncbi:mediator complex, subunit Med31 [Exophiala viscosa]|uniref:Mediator of RNA polymerase II transcription subunit 31 n=1 Tax=Exophiala viscosa TaxID=2486360 RepID=A0AAN6E3T0_9EURO|nr:mediator complex, subunit Med31 [Exophiala viscosa]